MKESSLPPDTWGRTEEIVRLWYSIDSTAKTGPVPAYDVRFDPASLKVEIQPRASSNESQDTDSKVFELTFSAAPPEKGSSDPMLSATLPDTLRSMVPTVQGTPPVWEVIEGAIRCVAKITNQEAGLAEATFLVKDGSSGRTVKITLYSAR